MYLYGRALTLDLMGGRTCAQHMLSTVLYLYPLGVAPAWDANIAFMCYGEV